MASETQTVNRGQRGGTDIFGHYKEQEAHEKEQNKADEVRRVKQSNSQGASDAENMIAADNFYRAKDDFSANKARNQGTGAPFAMESSRIVRESEPVREAQAPQQSVPTSVLEDYQTPRERQAGNPNLNTNTFNSLFGDSPQHANNAQRAKGKAATHNPVTWEAYSNYDAEADKPAHKSRYETYASAKQGGNNPIKPADAPQQPTSAGGQRTISNVTF